MRVAFLLNKFPLLSESFVLNQITGLIDRGCHVDIFVRGPLAERKTHADVESYGLEAIDLYQDALPSERRKELLRGVLAVALRHAASDHRLAAACLRNLRPGRIHDWLVEIYPVAEMLRRGPYDIVHAHYGNNGNWAVALRRLGAFRAKIITTFHDGFDLSTYIEQNGSEVYAPVFSHAELILPISEAVRDRIIELGCPAEKTAVHRVGVDMGRFASDAGSRPAGGPVKIASTARLVEMKGIEYGIRAVSALIEQGLQVQYRVAGGGELQTQLKSLIAQLGVGDQVSLLGWQDMQEVQQLLADTDIFLAPSVTDANGSQEGIPTALMEAMGCRIPVVATGYSGIPELIRDEVDGYLTAERDVDNIVDRLRRLINAPERRIAMGKRGRERVEQLHDIDKLNDRLLERYRALAQA